MYIFGIFIPIRTLTEKDTNFTKLEWNDKLDSMPKYGLVTINIKLYHENRLSPFHIYLPWLLTYMVSGQPGKMSTHTIHLGSSACRTIDGKQSLVSNASIIVSPPISSRQLSTNVEDILASRATWIANGPEIIFDVSIQMVSPGSSSRFADYVTDLLTHAPVSAHAYVYELPTY